MTKHTRISKQHGVWAILGFALIFGSLFILLAVSRETPTGVGDSSDIRIDEPENQQEIRSYLERVQGADDDELASIRTEVESELTEAEGDQAQELQNVLLEVCIRQADTGCLEDYIESLSSDAPEVTLLREQLAQTYISQGNTEKARETYEQLIADLDSQPDSEEAKAYYQERIEEL